MHNIKFTAINKEDWVCLCALWLKKNKDQHVQAMYFTVLSERKKISHRKREIIHTFKTYIILSYKEISHRHHGILLNRKHHRENVRSHVNSMGFQGAVNSSPNHIVTSRHHHHHYHLSLFPSRWGHYGARLHKGCEKVLQPYVDLILTLS